LGYSKDGQPKTQAQPAKTSIVVLSVLAKHPASVAAITVLAKRHKISSLTLPRFAGLGIEG